MSVALNPPHAADFDPSESDTRYGTIGIVFPSHAPWGRRVVEAAVPTARFVPAYDLFELRKQLRLHRICTVFVDLDESDDLYREIRAIMRSEAQAPIVVAVALSLDRQERVQHLLHERYAERVLLPPFNERRVLGIMKRPSRQTREAPESPGLPGGAVLAPAASDEVAYWIAAEPQARWWTVTRHAGRFVQCCLRANYRTIIGGCDPVRWAVELKQAAADLRRPAPRMILVDDDHAAHMYDSVVARPLPRAADAGIDYVVVVTERMHTVAALADVVGPDTRVIGVLNAEDLALLLDLPRIKAVLVDTVLDPRQHAAIARALETHPLRSALGFRTDSDAARECLLMSRSWVRRIVWFPWQPEALARAGVLDLPRLHDAAAAPVRDDTVARPAVVVDDAADADAPPTLWSRLRTWLRSPGGRRER